MTVVPDPAEQLSISQKLDFVIANQTQQNALITQLRSDFDSIQTEITAVQEQVTLFAHSVKGGMFMDLGLGEKLPMKCL